LESSPLFPLGSGNSILNYIFSPLPAFALLSKRLKDRFGFFIFNFQHLYIDNLATFLFCNVFVHGKEKAGKIAVL
jgi:hypothetical protein